MVLVEGAVLETEVSAEIDDQCLSIEKGPGLFSRCAVGQTQKIDVALSPVVPIRSGESLITRALQQREYVGDLLPLVRVGGDKGDVDVSMTEKQRKKGDTGITGGAQNPYIPH